MAIELLVKIKKELEEDFARNLDLDGDAAMWSENCLMCPSGHLEDLMEQIPEEEQEDYDDMMQTFICYLVSSHLLTVQDDQDYGDKKGQYHYSFDLPVNDYHVGFAIGCTKKEAKVIIFTLSLIVGLIVGCFLFF